MAFENEQSWHGGLHSIASVTASSINRACGSDWL